MTRTEQFSWIFEKLLLLREPAALVVSEIPGATTTSLIFGLFERNACELAIPLLRSLQTRSFLTILLRISLLRALYKYAVNLQRRRLPSSPRPSIRTPGSTFRFGWICPPRTSKTYRHPTTRENRPRSIAWPHAHLSQAKIASSVRRKMKVVRWNTWQ